MQRIVACWLVAIGAWSADAAGQRQITEEEFLGRLSPDHPAMAVARAAVGQAQAERVRRTALDDPSFSFMSEDFGEAGDETTVSLAWAPPLDGRRGLGVESAETGIRAAELRLEASQWVVRLKMRSDYASWALATRRRGVIREHAGSLDQIVDMIEKRARQGESSRLAAARIRLVAVEVRSSLGVAEAALAEAVAAVRIWDDSVRIDDHPVAPSLVDLLLEPTTEARLDIQALSLDIERAMLDERRAGRFVRFPELVLGWKGLEAPEGEFDGAVLGLNWSIPLGERGRGDRLAAASRQEASSGALELARARAEVELSSSVRAYEALVEAWRQSQTDLGETDWVIEAAFSRYRAGEAELTDLLDTLRSVLAARLAGEDLYDRALTAQRKVEQVTGQPLAMGGGA